MSSTAIHMARVIFMNLTGRAGVLVTAGMAASAVLAASACGGPGTASGVTTNGLQKRSPADVLQAAAAALAAAKSVHVVGTGAAGHVDIRMQHGATTGTLTVAGQQLRFMIAGGAGYINTDQAGLAMFGAPPLVQQHAAGRWFKVPASDFTGVTLAEFASQLTAYNGPLEPKVRQATLHGRKVVVVSWRNGSKLDVANTGRAYPLLAVFKVHNPGRVALSGYDAPLHITAPGNAISSPVPGTGGLGTKVVPPPAGFTLARGVDVHNGPMTPAAFNRWIGASNLAAKLHFIRGYDVTYYSTTNADSIEVTLFQFVTPADATALKAGFSPGGLISSRADTVIPGADDYDSRSSDQGTYIHGVIATKGNLLFVIADATGSAARVPLVQKLARQQYGALKLYKSAAPPSSVPLAAVEARLGRRARLSDRARFIDVSNVR